MTWKTISEIICISNSKRKELEKIIVDSNVVTNKREICERFNEFFTNIGPKLAEKIETGNKKRFDAYLKQRVLTTFSFTLVDDKSIIKCVSAEAPKMRSRVVWWRWMFIYEARTHNAHCEAGHNG